MADAPRGVLAIAARRRDERAQAIACAQTYATTLAIEIPLAAAVVFGSYARGDFNSWSDIDVLVLSDSLPGDARARLDLLWRHRPGGLEPVGWTLPEFAARRRRRDPIAVEADYVGVVVHGAIPTPLP